MFDERKAWRDKYDAELEQFNAKIDQWRAKAKEQSADARLEANREIEEIQDKHDSVRTRLNEVGDDQDDGTVWEDTKRGVENAWDDLKRAIDRATERFM